MTTTDTALTRLRADIEARKPWVEGWRLTEEPSENWPEFVDHLGSDQYAAQALDIATARALEYLRKRESLLWIKNKLQQNWQVEVSTYEAVAAACDAVKEKS